MNKKVHFEEKNLQCKALIVNEMEYLVTNEGKVYSKLKETPDKWGYITYTLGGRGYLRIKGHQLAAQAFLDNPSGYEIINHIDENPSNNNIDNLEWCTSKHNQNVGTVRARQKRKAGKPIMQCDKITHEPLRFFDDAHDASQQFEVPENARKRIREVAADIEDKRYHSAYGYWWRYATEEEISQNQQEILKIYQQN